MPTLIVQGESDPFGLPPRARNRKVVTVRGNHSLSSDLNGVAAAVRGWLVRMIDKFAWGPDFGGHIGRQSHP